jgi:hypothetical protein
VSCISSDNPFIGICYLPELAKALWPNVTDASRDGSMLSTDE